jgi:hypothetical protein
MLVAFVLLTHHLQRRVLPGCRLPFAAVLVATTPLVLHSVIQCYPNVLFAVLFLWFLWIVLRVPTSHRSARRLSVLQIVALGLLAGLAQLARSEFVICLPLLILYLFASESPRAALAHTAVILLGWLSLNAFEWWYALDHYHTPVRSGAFWANLANVKYGSSWRYYIELDRLALVREYWAIMIADMLRRSVTLAIQVGLLPLRHFGLIPSTLGLALATLGLARLGRIAAAAGRLKALGTVGLVAIAYLLLFALLRPSTRYFIWVLPLVGILMRFGIEGVAGAFGEWRGWTRPRRALAAEWAVLAALVPLSIAVPAKAIWGTTRHYVNGPTAYYTAAESDRLMRQVMIASLEDNYPAIRQSVPEDAVLMTDEPAVHWYADRATLFLPLDIESIAAIERDWFPLRYIYLGPTFWFEEAQPLNARYRHYLTDAAGRVPESFDGKLVAFLEHFPAYTPMRLFRNGGVLFALRSEVR